MNTTPWHTLARTGALALTWAVTSQATVTFVGNDLTTDAGWRTVATVKPNDIDGDNVYGSIGYYLAAGLRAGYKGTFLADNIITGTSNPDDINTLPSFLTSLEYTNPAERGRSWGGDGGNFGLLDNVGGGHTGFTGAAILLNAAVANPMSLTLKRDNSPDFRLTLILGNNPDEAPTFNDPTGQRITVDDGSGPVTQQSGETTFVSKTTYQSWDISAGSSDITIVFEGLPLGTGVARLSGLAIDVRELLPPTITSQPVGGVFLEGTEFSLSVAASGSQPLSYQWFMNDQPVWWLDSTNSILAFLPSLTLFDSGTYTVVITNVAGAATSAPVVVTVTNVLPVSIVSQPTGNTYLVGSRLTLSVAVEGTGPFSYQWLKNEEVIAGLDPSSAVFSIPSVALADAGTYTVIASNSVSSVTSAPAVVTVSATVPDKLANYQNALQNELSLIAWYPFDFHTADDLTTVHDGTLVGQTVFGTGIGGGADRALVLTGSGHVDLDASTEFDFDDGTGTIEAWIRADWTASPGFNPTLFCDREGGPTRYSLHMMNGKTQLAFWNGSQVSLINIPPAGTNWHHVAIVFDLVESNPTWSVVWDGALVGSQTLAFGTAAVPTHIGSVSTAGAERWIGALDEVVFYSEALSAQVIGAHYAAFMAGDPPVIVTQPVGGAFLAGSPVDLSVVATGPELAYQWSHDGVPIPGATAAVFSIASLSAADAGIYAVAVSNATAVVISSNAVITVLTADLASYQQTVRAEPGLISYYTFDAGTADDEIAVNHGTLNGAADWGRGVGNGLDQALILTGGHVDLGQVDAFDFANGIGSIEAWIRADWSSSPGYNPAIFADREGAAVNWSIHLMLAKDQVAFWNGSQVSLIPIPNAGKVWHHLVVVFNAGTWSVGWDGLVLATNALPFGVDPGATTQLGSVSAASAEQWLGALDEVAFYSVALSPDQIRTHYEASTAAILNFERLGDQLRMSWPQSGYQLQENADLGNPGGWTDVPGGDTSPVTVTMAPGSRFFRLIRLP